MPIARVMVILPYQSGLPGDVITNTFHFQSLDGEPINSARLGDVFTNLASFYAGIFNSATLSAMSSYVSAANVVMKGYDLDDPKPRTAVRESIVPLTVTQTTGNFTPAEAAAVLSYHTDYESGITKASQRGRIYLGGLGDQCITGSTASRSSTLKPDFITRVMTQASILCASSLADDWGWVVWSDKLQQAFAVSGGWVDNAIDTQRRRGQPATNRNLWTD